MGDTRLRFWVLLEMVYAIVNGAGADDEAREELRAAGYRVEVRA